jgi:hypothetical protein
MNAQIVKPLARVLAASSCDLGDEREVMRALRDAGIPEGSIIVLMDDAIEQARVVRAAEGALT